MGDAFKKGDTIWYIPGYSGDALISVRCTVLGLLECGGYDLDEPVGHCVHDDDLFLSREDAEAELRRRYDDHMATVREDEGDIFTSEEVAGMDREMREATLAGWRTRNIRFIEGTWLESERGYDWSQLTQPKERGDGWFGVEDVEGGTNQKA